ncbi:MAG: hypothetical protein PHQ86_09800 [Dehalococcoidales bacterium]|nr:hypothetical protein [Dehalococcoidales bacterium]
MEMRLNTLKQNAINAGYTEGEIEVRWVTDEEWAAIQEANKPIPDPNIPVLASLAEIDLKTIRSMREWLASKMDAPQFTKDYEAQAVEMRGKLV